MTDKSSEIIGYLFCSVFAGVGFGMWQESTGAGMFMFVFFVYFGFFVAALEQKHDR